MLALVWVKALIAGTLAGNRLPKAAFTYFSYPYSEAEISLTTYVKFILKN